MPRRTAKDLLGVPRALGRSHGRTQQDILRATPAPDGKLKSAARFLKVRVFGWIFHYLKSRIGGRVDFATYDKPAQDNGVYPLGDTGEVKVAIAGDWATGTEEAQQIGALIRKGAPHFTIHLGDVYYVGTEQEVNENMLGQQVDWPRGSVRSFALSGNHEMYARGKAYFHVLLPAMQQRASFFALRNRHWLLIGLDTGYNSVGIPFLELLFKPSCALPPELLAWLRDQVQLDRDSSRGIILMSHHQYYSAFEDRIDKPARQLAELIGRPVIWLWGHEHRFALYAKGTSRSSLQAYGRCLGHGGMPVEDPAEAPKEKRAQETGLVAYDTRVRGHIGSTRRTAVGFNGYADLSFNGPRLTIEHKDIAGALLVREEWEVDGAGRLRGTAIRRHLNDPNFVVRGDLGKAIEP